MQATAFPAIYHYAHMPQRFMPPRQGRLHQGFQACLTHAGTDLVARGMSAIGVVGATCSQNVKTVEEYDELLDQNEPPVADEDGLLRSARHG